MKHVSYWLGELLEDIGLGLAVIEHGNDLQEYFDGFANLIVEAIVAGWISRDELTVLSNKDIYAEQSKEFPVVKVEREIMVDF